MLDKKKFYIFISLCLVIGLAFGGVVYTKKFLTKAEEIALKQKIAPTNNFVESDMIGVFPPGFENEATTALTKYNTVYGNENVKTLTYQGYTLIVPPSKVDDIASVKENIDQTIDSKKANYPSNLKQKEEIEKIRTLFSVEGEILYNSTIGAYTDEHGFQYNFKNGEIINKQIGITGELRNKFENQFPYLKSNSEAVNQDKKFDAVEIADEFVTRLVSVDRSKELFSTRETLILGNNRVGISYGGTEIQLLVDTVSGTIIHYSKDS